MTRNGSPALRARRNLIAFNLFTLLGIGLISLYVLSLKAAGISYFCPFARLTHLYCAGCGGTRAAWALLRGDVLASLCANPFVLAGVAVLLYYEGAFIAALRHPGRRISSRPAILLAVFLVAFWVMRNLLLAVWGIDYLGNLIEYWR